MARIVYAANRPFAISVMTSHVRDERGGRPRSRRFRCLSYGIGNFHLYNGRPQEARSYFEKAVATNAWPALAFIVGEADSKRLR